MKTALQQLIVTLESMLNHGGDDDLFAAIEHAKNLLPVERGHIIAACIHGADNECGFGIEQAQEYYKETFNVD